MNPSTGPAKADVPPEYDGHKDELTCSHCVGWAWDKNHPERAQKIEIYDGEKLLAVITADRLRQDLRDAGFGTGKYGFLFPLPRSLKDGKPHLISLKIAGTDFELKSSPQEITCPP
jgi:hypothetical protein